MDNMNVTASESLTYCTCGCGTIVFRGDVPQGELEDHYVFEFDGSLDYIEIFVKGHKPAYYAEQESTDRYRWLVESCTGRE